MFKKSGKFVILIAMAVTFFTACAAPKAALPTPDLNLVRTEAVVTAVAQLTKQAALIPQATQTPIIPTLEPTVTPPDFVMTATPFYSGGGSSGGGSGSGGGSLSTTPIPTWTPIVYGAVFVTQNYLDGYVCPTGEEPDFKVTLQNLGIATWDTAHYYIRKVKDWEGNFTSNYPLTKFNSYFLPVNTSSGGKAIFTIDILCPKFPSEKAWATCWELINDNGDKVPGSGFCFRFYTGLQPTKTPTKTRTPSPG